MTVQEYNKSVKLYSDAVYGFLVKQLSNKVEAEDIVQNTFEKLWNNRMEVPLEKAKSYLFTVAYRNMIDVTRRQKLRRETTIQVTTPSTPFQDNLEIQELLEKGLQQLGELQRSLILLRDYEGYSYEEIAELTDLSLSQVKVYLYRGRKKLQTYISELDQSIQYKLK